MRFLFLAVVLRVLSLPGWFDWTLWPLVFFAIACRASSLPLGSLRSHYFAGGVFWLFAFYFLGNVTYLAPVGAALIMGATWFFETFLYRWLNKKISHNFSAFFALLICEWVRMKWFYLAVGGVPWASWALPFAESPFLPLAAWVGEYGFLVLFLPIGVYLSRLFNGNYFVRCSILFFLVGLLAFCGYVLNPVQEPTSFLKCLSIQPNISVYDKNDEAFAEQFYRLQRDLSWEGVAENPDFDMLVWAETMWPLPAVESGLKGLMRRPWPGRDDEEIDFALLEKIQSELVIDLLQPASREVYFLTGAHFYQPVGVSSPFENDKYSKRSTDFVLFSSSGELLEHFSKQMLVPFGETLPFGNKLPGSEIISDWCQSVFGLRPDFETSSKEGPLKLTKTLPKIGGAVCWENVFEKPFRTQSQRGAEAFIILSNEDWLGKDQVEMRQMVSATKFRAAETGKSILRATNTGLTCIVHPNGEVEIGLEPVSKGFWLAELPIRNAEKPTFYVAWGYLLMPFLSILFLIYLFFFKLFVRISAIDE